MKRLGLVTLDAGDAVLAEHLVSDFQDFGDVAHRQLLALGDGILVYLLLAEDFKENIPIIGLEYKLLGGPCAALLGRACPHGQDFLDRSCGFHGW
jgi:hypothetical protein